MIFSGASPSSTHRIIALTTWCSGSRSAAVGSGAPPPIAFGPVPPPQWLTAGSMNRRGYFFTPLAKGCARGGATWGGRFWACWAEGAAGEGGNFSKLGTAKKTGGGSTLEHDECA